MYDRMVVNFMLGEIYLLMSVSKQSAKPRYEFGRVSELSCFVGSISTADGSALVRLGNTTIVCGVKAEIAEPELDRDSEGYLGPYFPYFPFYDLNHLQFSAKPRSPCHLLPKI